MKTLLELDNQTSPKAPHQAHILKRGYVCTLNYTRTHGMPMTLIFAAWVLVKAHYVHEHLCKVIVTPAPLSIRTTRRHYDAPYPKTYLAVSELSFGEKGQKRSQCHACKSGHVDIEPRKHHMPEDIANELKGNKKYRHIRSMRLSLI
jgi:hypothetical protein